MKCQSLVLAIAAAVISVGAAAQDATEQVKTAQHHHYKLVDIGTLGGPTSGVPTVFYEIYGTSGARGISNRGAVTGTSDTSIPDPLCFFDPCVNENAFLWKNGVLTSLGALPGAQWSAVNWISSNGLVAGFSEDAQTDPLNSFPEIHGTVWQNGHISDLGTLPGGYDSWAFGVNNRGQVVGASTNGTPDPYSYYYFQIFGSAAGTQMRPFLWDRQNGMQDLGALGGPDAWAGLVNERGQVAGVSYTSFNANATNGTCAPNAPGQNPFFWQKDTGIVDIGTLGGTCGVPNAMNNRGQVVGQSYLAGNLVARAFLWDKNANPPLTDLGTLGGDNAAALWINDAGDVVGLADTPNPPGCSGVTCVHHAALWTGGKITDLGSVDGDPCSRALSINSKGQIVGFTAATCGGNATHSFLWQDGGPAVDLGTLVQSGSGLSLTQAIYIDDEGEIVGNGVLANGNTHAFLLIPCDENHPGIEGCDYSLWDPSTASKVSATLSPGNWESTEPGQASIPRSRHPNAASLRPSVRDPAVNRVQSR
jgi:probable HAF family extracellular repeat protein